MSIVNPSDFLGEVNIPNNEDTYNGVKSNVQYFIDKYEPLFLESLLGYTLYQQYVVGITPVPVEPATDPVTYLPIDAKWLAIQALAKPLIVNYVYYFFKRDEITYSSGVGTVKSKGENSEIASPSRKMYDRWNEMVIGVYKVVRHWDTDTYGDYYLNSYFSYLNDWDFEEFYSWFCQRGCRVADIFFKVNMFNL